MRPGALDGIDAVYGLHVWPTLPSGTIGVLPGPMMAASDHIRIVMKGKTSHAAMPHKGVDTIVAAAQFLTAAQTIVSRRVNPLYPAVLTFGKITGGTRYNVVADTVEIEGTCRTYHEEAQDAVETYLQDTLKGMDAMYGTESTLITNGAMQLSAIRRFRPILLPASSVSVWETKDWRMFRNRL